MGVVSGELKNIIGRLQDAKNSINNKYDIMRANNVNAQDKIENLRMNDLSSSIDKIECINVYNTIGLNPGNVLIGTKFYSQGQELEGTMPNNGSLDITVDNNLETNVFPNGYYEAININISRQNKTCTPSTASQTITSDKGKVLSSVIVDGDINLVPSNIKKNVKIFGVTGNINELDTSDATATGKDVLYPKTAYANGKKITGEIIGPMVTLTGQLNAENGIASDTQPYILSKNRDFNGIKTDALSVPIEQTGLRILADDNSVLYIPIEGLKKFFNITPDKIKKDEEILGVVGNVDSVSDIDTSDATATADDIFNEKTAYVNGEKITGNIKSIIAIGDVAVNEDGVSETQPYEILWTSSYSHLPDSECIKIPIMDAENKRYCINGEHGITISTYALAKFYNIKPSDIKKDVRILGVTGTLEAANNDTSDATAKPEDIAYGKTAYSQNGKITGTILALTSFGGALNYDANGTIDDYQPYSYKENAYILGTRNGTKNISDAITIPISIPENTRYLMDSGAKINVPIEGLKKFFGITPEKIKTGYTIMGVVGKG